MTKREGEAMDDESGYAKVNLFVGKYRVPKDGHIRLPNAKVRLLLGRETPEGWVGDGTEWWLMIEDGDFWPVMVRLSDTLDELKELSEVFLRPRKVTYTATSTPSESWTSNA